MSVKTVLSFPKTEILLILEDELFIELSTTSSMTDAFCLPGTALVPFCLNTVISVNVSPGHQRDRKNKKIAFLFPKICCFSLTSTIVLKESHLTVNFSFLS